MISQRMLDLVLDVASPRYRRRPWKLHTSTIEACLSRGLITVEFPVDPFRRPLQRRPKGRARLTEKGWAVAEVAKMLRDEQRESARLWTELRKRGGA